MCGRFVLVSIPGTQWSVRVMVQGGPPDTPRVQRVFEPGPEPEPRYNIAPTQKIVTILIEDGTRQAEWMRWGLIPSWAKPDKPVRNSFNARDDGLPSSGLWRGPLKRSRCLVPASGFYEWKKYGKQRQPMYIFPVGAERFYFAGLYDTWLDPERGWIRSCAIVTTGANGLMEPIHDRMPAILGGEAQALWLDPLTEDPDRLTPLLRPYPREEMDTYPVSRAVGSVAHDSPDCIKRIPEDETVGHQMAFGDDGSHQG